VRAPVNNALDADSDGNSNVDARDGLINIDFLFNRKEKYDKMVDLVLSNLIKAGERQKKYYDMRRRDDQFNVGDIVVIKNVVNSNLVKGVTASFGDLYLNKPAKVVEKHSDLTYTVMFLDGTKKGPLHIECLRKYITNDNLNFLNNVNNTNNPKNTVNGKGEDKEQGQGQSFQDNVNDNSDNEPNDSKTRSLSQTTSSKNNPSTPNPNNVDFTYDPTLTYIFTNSNQRKSRARRNPDLNYKMLHNKGIKVPAKGR